MPVDVAVSTFQKAMQYLWNGTR